MTRVRIACAAALLALGMAAGCGGSGGRIAAAKQHSAVNHTSPPAAGSSSTSTSSRPPASGTTPPATAALPGSLFSVPALAKYLGARQNNVTAAVYDSISGRTYVYRPGVAEVMASIMKVDILATFLWRAQAEGTQLSAAHKQLATGMIEHSNNGDAQDLWEAEGGAATVGAFDGHAGLTETTLNQQGEWGLSTTTAADQLRMLKAVVYPNALLNDTSRGYELGLMSQIEPDQHWGVSGGLAAGTGVELKNGWLDRTGGWQVNSIGHVHGSGRDYLIAVLTNGNHTESEGIDTIEGISGMVWQALAPAH